MRTKVMSAAAIVGLLIGGTPRESGAQSTWTHIRNDFGWAFGDMWHGWKAPFRASSKDYLGAGAVIAGIAALSVFDDNVDSWVVRHPDNSAIRALRPFRQEEGGVLSEFGSGRFLLPASGALYVVGLLANSRALRDAGIGCAAAHQAETIPRGIAYYSVSRLRPLTANGDQYDISFPGGKWEVHSFYAGHLANAVACATVWSTRFKLGPLEPIMYAAAIAVGAGRIVDRKHWVSDIVAGAVISYPLARMIGRRQLERLEDPTKAAMTNGAFAFPRAEGGYTIGWRTSF